MKALIVGVTGLVGSHVAEQVANDPYWTSVTMLARKEKTRDLKAHVQWRVVDFDAQGTYEHLGAEGYTHVFCCLGTTIKIAGSQEAFAKVDYEYPLRVAEATAPAHYLLVSSLGANAKSFAFYTRTKGQLEDALKHLRLGALDIFHPSLLLGERSGPPRGAEGAMISVFKAVGFVMAGPLAKYHAVDAAQVARAMVRTAKSSTSGTRTHSYREIVE